MKTESTWKTCEEWNVKEDRYKSVFPGLVPKWQYIVMTSFLNPGLEKVCLQLINCSPIQGDIQHSGWLLTWELLTYSINGSLHSARAAPTTQGRQTRCSGSRAVYSCTGSMCCFTVTKEMVRILTTCTPVPSQWSLWCSSCNSIQSL